MTTLWCWLDSNSSQIQALAGVAAVIVAALVGWVAWKQKAAAEAQAEAAKKQTTAAEAQAEAARQQVEAANQQVIATKQQIETSLLIADRQTTPHISITAALRGGQIIVVNTIAILNNGTGPALNCEVKYNDDNVGNDDPKVKGVTLVVGDSLSVLITDGQRAARNGLRMTYETIFGTKYALEFQWNGHSSQAVNQKLFRLSA